MPPPNRVIEHIPVERAEVLLRCNRQLASELQKYKMSNEQYRSEINKLRSQLSDKELLKEHSSSAGERVKTGKAHKNERSKLKRLDENSIPTPSKSATSDAVTAFPRHAFTQISENKKNSRAVTPKPMAKVSHFSTIQENADESAENNDSLTSRPRRQAAPTAGSMRERSLVVKLRR